MSADSRAISPYLSDKLRILSFISILMVIYIHMYYTKGEQMEVLNVIEDFWGKGICLIAVPLFFVMSGYLFFYSNPVSTKEYRIKIQKRVRTLLVPYFLMNTVAILFYVCLDSVVDKVPMLSGVINFRILEEMRQVSFGEAIFKMYWSEPVAFQLWFIRDLMIAVLLSGCIGYVLKLTIRSKEVNVFFWVAQLCLLVTWTCYEVIFWFSLGGWLALQTKISLNRPMFTSRKRRLMITFPVAIACIASVVINNIYPAEWWKIVIAGSGIVALWVGYDAIDLKAPLRHNSILKFLCSYTFFCYLVHEPFLNIIKKTPLLVSQQEWMLIGCYIFVPLVFYPIASFAGKWLKKEWSRGYFIFTGGR